MHCGKHLGCVRIIEVCDRHKRLIKCYELNFFRRVKAETFSQIIPNITLFAKTSKRVMNHREFEDITGR